MKLKDAILKVDRSDENCTPANSETFSEQFGFHVFWNTEFAERVKGYWLWRWLCTDTWAGYRVYYMDDQPVAVSWQPMRKSLEEIEWVSQDAYNKVRDFMMALMAKEFANPTFVNMEDELPAHGYNVTYGSQLLDDEGVLADGTKVKVVRKFGLRYETPIERWQTIDIQLPNGTIREHVPLTEVFFPYRLTVDGVPASDGERLAP